MSNYGLKYSYIVNVRRTGRKTGRVSVRYVIVPDARERLVRALELLLDGHLPDEAPGGDSIQERERKREGLS